MTEIQRKQKTFDTCIKYMFSMKEQSVEEEGTCRYRAENGNKCPIGYIIPDSIYNNVCEDGDIGSLLNWGSMYYLRGLKEHLLEAEYSIDEGFLSDVQDIHDSHFKEEIVVEAIAKYYKLKYKHLLD